MSNFKFQLFFIYFVHFQVSNVQSIVSKVQFPISNVLFPVFNVWFQKHNFTSPVSNVPFPVSNVLFVVSKIRFQVFNVQFPVSYVPFPVSYVPFPVSTVPFPVSNVLFLVSKILFQVFNLHFPVSYVPFPVSNVLFPVSHVCFPLSSVLFFWIIRTSWFPGRLCYAWFPGIISTSWFPGILGYALVSRDYIACLGVYIVSMRVVIVPWFLRCLVSCCSSASISGSEMGMSALKSSGAMETPSANEGKSKTYVVSCLMIYIFRCFVFAFLDMVDQQGLDGRSECSCGYVRDDLWSLETWTGGVPESQLPERRFRHPEDDISGLGMVLLWPATCARDLHRQAKGTLWGKLSFISFIKDKLHVILSVQSFIGFCAPSTHIRKHAAP